ncbi:MAG: N-acetyl sugar amidotransferase [Candidatus Eisenbacteria sp.]|nr:N-acetyl sugar amidotransferase [Candidatus Eisenbacteria bacterium]
MKYCTRCILPDTRPNLVLDGEGVCNACRAHATKPLIDWVAREEAFRAVVERAKRPTAGYDCVVPVSGGKDSTWQVVKCLEYGLHPLAVTWRTPGRTAIGQRNLDNLVDLGVDHIDYQINPRVEKIFMYRALTKFGTTALPMHMALFNIPLGIAVRFKVPLVIWGENSAFEYGGDYDERKGFALDRAWVAKYGVTHGTTAEDWVSDELGRKDLTAYFGPSDEESESSGVLAVFLGYYFEWDPETTRRVAQEHGFEARTAGARVGYWNYADIDDDFISVHHYLKWYKFGFTRLFDNLSVEIRNGRVTRDEALSIVRKRGDQTPHEDIEKCCRFMGIGVEHFFESIQGFRNRDIWEKRNGTWTIPDFIIPDWEWT